MNTKSLRVEVKDADKGEVTAVFSTFNVVDSDGDVTVPGAFDDGAEVLISAYGHASWSGALPAGMGKIRTTDTEAILDGQFFLDTAHGADTFKVVKRIGPLGQWSYGFDIAKHSYGEHDGRQVRFLEKLKPFEVSPVLVGAGVNTRTLAAKSGLTFRDEAATVLAGVTALVDRAADVMAKRAEKGKGLGGESAALLEQVEAQLKRLAELHAEPEPVVSAEELHREYLRYVALARAA